MRKNKTIKNLKANFSSYSEGVSIMLSYTLGMLEFLEKEDLFNEFYFWWTEKEAREAWREK